MERRPDAALFHICEPRNPEAPGVTPWRSATFGTLDVVCDGMGRESKRERKMPGQTP